MQFTRMCINKKILYMNFTWGQCHKIVAQYSLTHLTYTPAKLEVVVSNILGGDAFTRIYIYFDI